MSFTGKRVTVMGLGTRGGGVGVARFLAECGAVVTVTDGKSEEDLAQPIGELVGLPIRYALGRHDERDFMPAGTDMVVRNPGVRRSSPYLKIARESGVPVEMEMTLFFRLCPALIIGITGTKGKTTTATICASMLSAWDNRTVLAGNMGVSALAQLAAIYADTPVVIEVSNWQLEALDEHKLAPRIAVLTNISEDHLDTYNGFGEYANTKRSIAIHQTVQDILIVNHDDIEAMNVVAMTAARVVPFGTGPCPGTGVWYEESSITIRNENREFSIQVPKHIARGGRHLVANAAAAAGAAFWRGAPIEAIQSGLERFHGVKDRNEWVANIDGVEYVNDTAATTPAATLAALQTYAGCRIHLITGGSDKKVDLAPLAEAASRGADWIYLLNGSATPTLLKAFVQLGVDVLGPFESMKDVVAAAASNSQTGDLVLLSPGCASFGLFRDEFDRGEQFRSEVRAISSAMSSSK